MATDTVGWEPRAKALGETLLIVFGAYLFASVVLAAVSPPLIDAGIVTPGSTEEYLSQFALQYAGFLVVTGWYALAVRDDPLIPWATPSRRGLGLIVAGIVVLVGANNGITRLFAAVDVSLGDNAAVTVGAGEPAYLLTMIVFSLLVVGPAEELLFRGVVQGRLRETWGVWPSILAATVLFGLSHASVSGGAAGIAAYIVTATLLGVLLGYLYERTDNIVVPAVIHGVNNAVIFAWLYLGEVGVV